MYVKNYMTKKPITIDYEATISEALTIMNETTIHRLPVMKYGKLVGLITDGNIQKASPTKATSLSMYEINYLLSKTTVRDYMTKDVVTVGPDVLLEEAVSIMKNHGVACLPVLDNDELVGIITETDLFDAFIDLLGFNEKGARVSLEVANDEIGVMHTISEVLMKNNINIYNIAVYREPLPVTVVLRVDCCDKERIKAILEQDGLKVSHILVNE